jgi:hypothetical protein
VRRIRDCGSRVRRLDARVTEKHGGLGIEVVSTAIQRTARSLDVCVSLDDGWNRGEWALRFPFEHLGARVYPDMFSLDQAHKAFDTEGRLVDSDLQERLNANLVGFMNLVEASKHYPCAKSLWVE